MKNPITAWLKFRDGFLDGRIADLGLLAGRLSLGGMMAILHGWGKLANFDQYASRFADPFGIGPAPSLALAVFAEFFCSILLALGLATRLAASQLIVTMCVAAFYVHGNAVFTEGEMALLYLTGYVILFLAGPGRFSVDALIEKKVRAAQA